MEGKEALPTGWERTPVRGDEISFRRESGEIAVAATRTTLSNSSAEWELTVEHEAEGTNIAEPFGQVSDRETALGALRSCMRAIDVALPADESPDQLTASDMRLGDIVRS